MRVHGLRWSKASASYSARCRATAHCIRRSHWSREDQHFQRERFVSRAWFTLAASAWAQRTERNGGFGFQTHVKDRFLNQRSWTCWYSCGKKQEKSYQRQCLVLRFFLFSFWKAVCYLCCLPYVMLWRLSLNIFFYYYLFDSLVFAKHSVIASSY